MDPEIWQFKGGLQLDGYKELSNTEPARVAELPEHLVIPLQQHIGEATEPIVKVGDHVLKGQVIARCIGYVSTPIHASTSGKVIAIDDRPVAHPSGFQAACIVIESDGDEQWIERQATADYTALEPSELRNRVREAGIVGLGGAGFPAFIKLTEGRNSGIETLIINGAAVIIFSR